MQRDRLIAGGMMAAGLAVIGAFALSQSPALAQAATDGPGPNLIVEVGGSTTGQIVIDLLPDVAPKHVEQITALAAEGAYDGVVFHRVIDGFMAQTGDVEFGKQGGNTQMAGMGGSSRADLPAEFSDLTFERGTVGMARSQSPDSANSQFFIMFAPGEFLNGQYTVVGNVVSGMEVVDAIKKGDQAANGSVTDPDFMASVTVAE
ncbi:peptidylprolyl isomerase [Frigidibacter albus]|uniref:Peptidyl-prolyl cis-trans isomerase n=1 Tax=Frigidibacter albus TaxID=1465486 RepID=A0A6L8VD94_9RHOB|nr:peptidylprolyl isomerase [Frigidibacter albus]MZQ88174.1 peptidylprolyl isomerase [Frigidibacter albus]NBE30152.1 peptidylprolyl isomerase [Frigidibacter albus]GGH47036.1 peptidyl-prolyl cis-trans isomerase [Frigidibacter albus]